MSKYSLGFTSVYNQNRLNHLRNTAYPAQLATAYLALYMGSPPDWDGNGGTEATGTRPSIALAAPAQDGSSRWYTTNSSNVSATLVNTNAGDLVGFAIFGASTGGTPIYTGRLPSSFRVEPGAAVTIPAGNIRLYAETPTQDA